MVVFEFLSSIEGAVHKALSGMLFENSSGDMEKMHTFKQNFPIRSFEETEEEKGDIFPYCLIRAENGSLGNVREIRVSLIFGICDRSKENAGELRILNIIERISQYFLSNRILDGMFRLSYESPIEWALPTETENTYPYFYGLLEMQWESFFQEMEDIYA